MAEATNTKDPLGIVKTQDTSKPKNFPALLQLSIGEIQKALPSHLKAERMARVALTAFRRTPKLAECDPRSVIAAVIQAAQLGLEPDTLGRAYIIPYKVSKKTDKGWESHMEAQFVPGWKGLVDLMNRSGQGSVWTGAVFEGDDFDYQLGGEPFLHHKPHLDAPSDNPKYVYAIGRPKGCDWPLIEVWSMAKVKKHRDRYNKVGDKHYSFDNMEMYGRKVVLLQILKYMPCSAELSMVMDMDSRAGQAPQELTLKDAIDGQSWVPPEDDGQPESPSGTVGLQDEKKDPAANTGQGAAQAGAQQGTGGGEGKTGAPDAGVGPSSSPGPSEAEYQAAMRAQQEAADKAPAAPKASKKRAAVFGDD